ncbi:GNAT family N-acetyltransferase [Flammeovirga kamogawensis]|uniref:GNAT family N-acetyltransferase n=1 Tax=Flammeovirga kamogawensis TaxID=373891 RepID=A0ABX8GT22_9BACT|nr:GNAT family N-acetyltransferase [Flammeovirga kamogawensis]MBB6462528.1 RimJ/RimL family protein N-acetyltransferase [Flammeovirga kamogawensis]QWG06735.1 GNAT family N-acetyltransferase [Flammeovirga kamogawensis]TRX68558.1 GNAT family N-acetyltransferase [Flammeovirga kamogawensis]
MRTDRLQLEHIKPTDFTEVLLMFKENDIFKYIAPLQTFSEVEHIAYLHRKIDEIKTGKGYLWVARVSDSDEFVGLFNLNPIPDSEEIQIGWILSEKSRGKGFALEAAKRVFDFGVNEWKIDPIYAVVEDGNIPSEKIALKLGLKYFHDFKDNQGTALKKFKYSTKSI